MKSQQQSENQTTTSIPPARRWLPWATLIGVGIGLVLLLLRPEWVGLAARYTLVPVLVSTAVLLYPAYRVASWWGHLAALGLTLLLFGLPLVGLWHTGISEPVFIIGGLLPASDATQYYVSAERVLLGGTLLPIASWRPLFAATFATVLAITQHHLQWALALLTALTAVACFVLSREIQRSSGALAGVLVCLLLFLFARRYTGAVLTEHLGLLLGAVGWALLWRGAKQQQMLPVLAGLALTSLALNARAGPFFVLPALLIWGCLVFRGRSRISLTLLVAGIGAIVLGFAANMLVLRVVGSPSGQPFSNFAYNLYGLVVGGAQWRQVLVDHPELASLVEPALSQQIYALTWQAFLSNPLGPLIGAVRIWASLFYPGGGFGSGGGAFSFIYGHPVAGDTLIALLVRLVAFAGSGWGAWQCYRQRQKPVCSLLLAALVGLLLSVPFVPPMIDPYAMRAYAAFMPMVVTLATLGTLWLWQHLSRTRQAALWDSADPQRRSSAGLLIGAVLLMGWVVLGPIAVKALSQAPQITAPPPCAAGQESLVVPIYAGSAVTLQAEQATPTLPTLVVPLDAFRAGVPDSGWNWRPEFVEALRSLEGDQTLVVTFDRHADDPPVLLVVATQLLPPTASLVHVCGQQPPESELFFVTSLEPVTP